MIFNGTICLPISKESKELDTLLPDERFECLLDILVEAAYKHVPPRNSARKPATFIQRHRRIRIRKRRKLIEQMERATSNAKKVKIKDKLISIKFYCKNLMRKHGVEKKELL